MKKICIYHSRDLDGWISGAIIKLFDHNVDLIGWDYGDDMTFMKEFENADIVFVDIFPLAKNLEYLQRKNKVTWIDHHISAINDANSISLKVDGLRDVNYAACELTWKYCFPESQMPELVRLLGRYDCFGHKGTSEELKVLEFQYGARQLISNIEDAYSYLILARGRGDWSFDADLCEEIHLKGKAIYAYLCTEAKHSYKKIFSIELDGYKFACINQERFNPINFGIDYHKDGYDGFACFWYQDGQYNYSLYNDNGLVDCSVIAKNRGGGGHKGASGFRINHIL